MGVPALNRVSSSFSSCVSILSSSAYEPRSVLAVLPLEVADLIGLVWHDRLQPALAELTGEGLADHRILVRVLDLVARDVLDALARLVGAPRRVEGEVAVHRVAHVEVLVEPAVRRNEDARLVPRDEDLLAALGPHVRVA